jgi:carbon catabolite-derepressing protein kinase
MLRDKYAKPEESVFVYVTIQLYSIERDTFLVDFKASGYENLEHRFVKEMKVQGHAVMDSAATTGSTSANGGHIQQEVWKRLGPGEHVEAVAEEEREGMGGDVQVREKEELVPMGRATAEKRATSPFPFLDVASGLIIQLAEGS